MSVDEEQIRAALEHRIRAAGLDDPARIPEPRLLRLPGDQVGEVPRGRRLLATAAAIAMVVAAATLALAGHRRHGDDAPSRPLVTAPATSTTVRHRPTLPPPWPKLPTRASTAARPGWENVMDALTGVSVSVDSKALESQQAAVTQWLRIHPEDRTGTDADPILIFTHGSFRFVYRSDLDCSLLPGGRQRPACVPKH